MLERQDFQASKNELAEIALAEEYCSSDTECRTHAKCEKRAVESSPHFREDGKLPCVWVPLRAGQETNTILLNCRRAGRCNSENDKHDEKNCRPGRSQTEAPESRVRYPLRGRGWLRDLNLSHCFSFFLFFPVPDTSQTEGPA